MKKLACALLVFASAFSSQALAAKYTIYCANGKIEVDMRDLNQMLSARGKNTHAIKTFDYKTDADKFAASLGGVGASCKK